MLGTIKLYHKTPKKSSRFLDFFGVYTYFFEFYRLKETA